VKIEINDGLWNNFHETVQYIRENATRKSLREAVPRGDTAFQQLVALVDDAPDPWA
jgi:hypothetical protein